MYINSDLSFNPRNDLTIKIKTEQCEASWVELIFVKQPNKLIGKLPQNQAQTQSKPHPHTPTHTDPQKHPNKKTDTHTHSKRKRK